MSGRLLNPNEVSSSSSEYVNFTACANSIQTNIVVANPEFRFDYFIQSWNPDLASSLNDLYKPLASSYEQNSIYSPILERLTKVSLRNEPKKLLHLLQRPLKSDSLHYLKTYAGISQALAIRKAVQLFENTSNPNDYDLVILARPDVVLLNPMNLSEYSSHSVYVNQYEELKGDFHWVFNPRYLGLFSSLIDSIDEGGYHLEHLWIRNFIRKFYGENYVEDKLKAGRDEEVLRKVKSSMIPLDKLKKFGVTQQQYDSYDVVA